MKFPQRGKEVVLVVQLGVETVVPSDKTNCKAVIGWLPQFHTVETGFDITKFVIVGVFPLQVRSPNVKFTFGYPDCLKVKMHPQKYEL